ncbi:MAG TPA: hypothetical protein VGS58_20770 [Candidatus Sulfopaludibacter sp.]|nr:hypothetical protein [Candidatus Sulfopaludibacter sp.]
MKMLAPAACALFLCLSAAGQQQLKTDLLSLSHTSQSAAERDVALHLRALSEKTHEPSREAVEAFARDLVRALRPQPLRDPQAAQLVAEIDSVFKSAGTSTAGYFGHIESFQAALGVVVTDKGAVRRLGEQLAAIGKQVRGPEDTPVR